MHARHACSTRMSFFALLSMHCSTNRFNFSLCTTTRPTRVSLSPASKRVEAAAWVFAGGRPPRNPTFCHPRNLSRLNLAGQPLEREARTGSHVNIAGPLEKKERGASPLLNSPKTSASSRDKRESPSLGRSWKEEDFSADDSNFSHRLSRLSRTPPPSTSHSAEVRTAPVGESRSRVCGQDREGRRTFRRWKIGPSSFSFRMVMVR